MTIQRKSIAWADFRLKFEDNSRAYGFSPAKVDLFLDDILILVAKWRNDGFVDIYEHGDMRFFGMIKSSQKDASGNIYECYADFYHSRITPGTNDPLLLLTFKNVTGDSLPWLIVESIIKHDQYFGRKGLAKMLKEHLRNLREAVALRINIAREKFKSQSIQKPRKTEKTKK